MPGSCGWFPLSHAEIERWVERHRDDLPRTLGELSLLPIPSRKVIVRAVSSEVRIALWRAHLATFLVPRGATRRPAHPGGCMAITRGLTCVELDEQVVERGSAHGFMCSQSSVASPATGSPQ